MWRWCRLPARTGEPTGGAAGCEPPAPSPAPPSLLTLRWAWQVQRGSQSRSATQILPAAADHRAGLHVVPGPGSSGGGAGTPVHRRLPGASGVGVPAAAHAVSGRMAAACLTTRATADAAAPSCQQPAAGPCLAAWPPRWVLEHSPCHPDRPTHPPPDPLPPPPGGPGGPLGGWLAGARIPGGHTDHTSCCGRLPPPRGGRPGDAGHTPPPAARQAAGHDGRRLDLGQHNVPG